METRINTKGITLTPAEQDRIRTLDGRMSRYFRKLLSMTWTFSGTKDACTASCGVHSQSGYFRSRVTAERAGAAMDLAFEKVVRQRRRERVKAVTERSRTGATRRRLLACAAPAEVHQ
jgi:ribosome-associated translation inhibitor RaiA